MRSSGGKNPTKEFVSVVALVLSSMIPKSNQMLQRMVKLFMDHSGPILGKFVDAIKYLYLTYSLLFQINYLN